MVVAQTKMAVDKDVHFEKRPNTACTRLVGLAAFSGRFLGSELILSKQRCLRPPTSG